MKDLLLITHVADPDGITPVILAKFTFENFDYLLLNPKEVDQSLEENLDKYKEIHIVDLGITKEMADKINEKEEYKNKVKIFDHHISNSFLNDYSFAKVIDEKDGHKECGTTNYYNYLKENYDNVYLNKNSLIGLVEQVRLVDTYDFKNEEEKQALNLDYLFSILGRENYIDYFYKYIKENDTFEYRESEKFLIKLETDKMKNYIENYEKDFIKAKLDNYNVGIMYAERYRSQIGSYMLEKYKDLDFMIIINIAKSISFRSQGKVDLSVFASKYNGGGHKNAAGAPIPLNLLEDITKMIFKNIEIKEEK